ncbi:MAG: group III truncated hemoglobin [Flavobacteriaceae bacterium]|nr:group III truncated hemoglobin [Flavobacteriaceae bacterium]
MKKDIENREDIYLFVKEFYVKLLNDEVMHHFFAAFTNSELLEKHLQILVDFWDNILFYSGTYQRNAMKPHLDLQAKKPFKAEHFKLWLLHFNNTIDEHFKGEIAHAAKSRALSIATVIQIKTAELGKQ